MAIYIGVTMNEKPGFGAEIRYQYYDALAVAGAIPLALPPLHPSLISPLLDSLDGLLLSGGGDMEPHHFGEAPLPKLGILEPARDAFELPLTREAWRRGLPMLAICRGMQVLNIALGGSIWQDISYMPGDILQHRQEDAPEQATQNLRIVHPALAELLGSRQIMANSHHHQTVKQVAQGLEIAALADDGVIEAFWPRAYQGFCLGVQWHPERLSNQESSRIFARFVAEAQEYRKKEKKGS